LATKKKVTETPLMKQYNEIKGKYPDALLLFRVGDFYETFGQDAIKASKVLGIVLTQRKNGAASHIELAGFPHHSLDTYLPKLVNAGNRVAICDQLEDPKATKTIVKRGVTELVTPGVALNDQVLRQNENNYLAAIFCEKKACGAAFLDISTGEFHLAEGSKDYVDRILRSLQPSEVLLARPQAKQLEGDLSEGLNTFIMEDWAFTSEFGREKLLDHFGTKSLKGFGVDDMKIAQACSGAVMHYLRETQHDRIDHITSLSRINPDSHMWIDRFTARNLELFHPSQPGGKALIDILDQTCTPMGSRMMRKWLAFPLIDKKSIESRQQCVHDLLESDQLCENISAELSQIGDLERMISKAVAGKITPREVNHLKSGLEKQNLS
jgi:DNA mismatch repair protein MutS